MPDNCNNCPLEPRVEALEKSNDQHGNTHREIFRRLNEAERKSAVQEAQYKAIEDTLEEIKDTVNTLAAKPGKRWEAIVEKTVWAVCAAMIAFLLAKIGL